MRIVVHLAGNGLAQCHGSGDQPGAEGQRLLKPAALLTFGPGHLLTQSGNAGLHLVIGEHLLAGRQGTAARQALIGRLGTLDFPLQVTLAS
ncbi:MAG: hypothetical protein ACMX3H_16950 [Sodalis sp. (in: enterobacteria)]|uniref:hypothetical protein n=1 Tax=Sodalis sp. (in: enterobacteria) TaxID=1898979 RepID=UPI0039E3BF65